MYDPIAGLINGAAFNTRKVVMDIPGAKYYLFAGLAGMAWYVLTYYMRYR